MTSRASLCNPVSRRWRQITHAGRLAACLGSLAAGRMLAQLPPADPPAASPSPAIVEPALPTDPTAPATVPAPGAPANPRIQTTSTTPVNPLIPTPLAVGIDPPQRANAATLPAPPPPTVPADPSAIPVAAPVAPDSTAPTTTNIGTARRFQYAFALTLGVTYDDNIFLEPTSTRSDVYFTIQPTVVLGFGGGGEENNESNNQVRFSYSPQALIYTDNTDLDTVQHYVNLAGIYHFSRLTLRGSQDIQILRNTDIGNPHPSYQIASPGTINPEGTPVSNNPTSNVNLDVGQRTRLNLYSTLLTGNYYISDKLSTDVSGSLTINDYGGQLLGNRTLSASAFLNYVLTGKTTVGAGLSGGYLFTDRPNPDQGYEQGSLRLSYVPSAKLIFSGQIGLELRQSTDNDRNALTPVFDLSLSYTPFDGTSIILAGNRQVQASAVLAGQDYRLTGFTLGLSQRFFQKLFARLSIGYTHSEYVATLTNVQSDRTDDYFFVQPGLDYNLNDKVIIGAFYSHRQNGSTLSNRDFSDNQVGARLSLTF